MTEAQVKEAQAVLKVFEKYAVLKVDVQRKPEEKDWESSIRKLAADPEARQLLDTLDGLAGQGQHVEGSADFDVLDVRPTDVATTYLVLSCANTSALELRDGSGQILVPAASGERYLAESLVKRFDAGGWLVSVESIVEPRTKC